MALLDVRDVTLRFGGIVALDGVSFDVEEGHISGLIGPNGAGKTTAFNVITRLYKPDSGEVVLDGESILKAPAHKIVRKGIARTFQNIQLFRTMSVLENVLVGAHGRGRKVGAGRGVRGARRRRAPRARALSGGGAAVRHPEARRARSSARRQAAPAPPRRAGGRPEPRGGRRARRLHQADPRRLRAHRAPRRAPHEPRHVHLRPRERPQLRTEDRRRRAGRRAGGPRGDRGVPRLDDEHEEPTQRRSDPRCQTDAHERRTSDDAPRARRRRGALRPGAGAARRLARRAEGEVVAVLGANGAGKTTTLRAISGTVSRRARSSSTASSSRAGPRRPRGRASRTCPRAAARSSS